MTILSQQPPDVVRVAVGERGVVGSGCLLSAMSGVEAPPQAAPSSPPPSPTPLPAHHTAAHDDDLPVTTTTVSTSDPLSQVVARSRRKLENEDSSYDSDFEPCEWTPASPQPEDDDDQHDDVCRTVSDTLGAEFAEYVTIKHNPPPHPPSTTSIITSTDTATTSSSPSLTTQVITSSSSSSNVAVVTTSATTTTSSTKYTTTTTTIATPVTTSTNITTPTSVTTTTITTVSTTSVTSDTGSSKTDQKSCVRATSPAVRLPSSSPPPPSSLSSSGGPPFLSITPPARLITATTPPTVTLTQAPPSVSTPSSCTNITSSSSTPVVTVTSSSSSSSSASTLASSSEVASGVSWVVQHAGYASQVEFGVKLGYSEALVQLALVKLGGTPDKDELLAELIRLGTSLGRPEGEGDTNDDVVDIKDEAEQHQQQQQPALKPIIIDGSNVAMRHGNKTVFSCRGLRICVDWFRGRGHTEITVFVPAWRKEAPRWDTPITDQEILLELEQENVLVFTPSRVCGGKRIVSYDDRYILNEAVATGGVVVSNDNYRDLAAETQAFRKVIEESLLMYSWVNGRFVPPDDPLGRNGPTLDAFLRRTPKDRQAPCPYGRKCTYGNKCKYMHPERGTAPLKSVTERLQEQAQRHYQKKVNSRDSSPGEGLRGKSLSLPVGVADSDVAKKPLQRTQSNVPSVSLTLPSALTQETPTHDLGPNTTKSTASHTHRHLMPPQMESHPLDPLRSSTLFKSDSSLYHLYPSQGPPASYGASTWGWESPGTMPNPQSGPPPHSQPQNYGAHMPLAKNLSDPDSVSSENPHKKLQRQLTLNPAYDSRLYKIVGFKEPAPELFPLHGSVHQQSQQQQAIGQVSPSRTVKRDNDNLVYSQVTGGITGRVSPGYSSQFGSREQLSTGLHPPLTRHSSQEGGKHMTSLPGHLYPPYSHPHVTRFSSAPDPIWGGHQQTAPGPPHITRLNSTSDTRLNLYGCGNETQFISEVYDEPMSRLPPFHPAATHHSASPVPGAPSPGPIGSRPMSPQQGPVLHRSAGVSSRQHKSSQQHLSSQQTPSFPNPITGGATHEDTRLRVYYHLSNLFPEAQVRAVLAMYPDETDPQKICTSILSRNTGPVGSRPMSPQQPSQSAVSHQAQNVPVRGSSPLTTGFSNPHPSAASSHEDARLRAFYHLSQLFPEAQVRAVLARFPDETDAKKLCATLIGLSGNQS